MQNFRDELDQLLDGETNLPAFPLVILELTKALRSENISAPEIENIISQDPILAANVLRVANSALYTFGTDEIASITIAVTRLGMAEVRRLCSVISMMRSTDGFGKGMDHKLFWKHCMVTAVATGVIRTHCHTQDTFDEDEAYIAGLLHDIGVLFLDHYFREAFHQTRALAEEQDLTHDEAERVLLELDHGEIGGLFLRRWNLPKSIVEAVTWHHQPGRASAESRPLVQAVHLSEFVCTCLGVGDGGDGFVKGFSESAWHDLGILTDDIRDIIDEVKTGVARNSKIMSLI